MKVDFIPDKHTDMYQIGRCINEVNDISIPGHVYDDNMLSSNNAGNYGSISRYACRIVCEREIPHRCFIYAGGFNLSKVQYIHHS
jgi:hypothetical protein